MAPVFYFNRLYLQKVNDYFIKYSLIIQVRDI